jgi:hypothetical protein
MNLEKEKSHLIKNIKDNNDLKDILFWITRFTCRITLNNNDNSWTKYNWSTRSFNLIKKIISDYEKEIVGITGITEEQKNYLLGGLKNKDYSMRELSMIITKERFYRTKGAGSRLESQINAAFEEYNIDFISLL